MIKIESDELWSECINLPTDQISNDLISILRKALTFFGEWTILFVHPQDNKIYDTTLVWMASIK